MKKLLTTIAGFIFLLTPALAFASTYNFNSGELQGQTATTFKVNRTGCATSSACDVFWSGLTSGNTFVISGGTAVDGTYHFVSYVNGSSKIVTVTETTWNIGTVFAAGTVTSGTVNYTLTYTAGSHGSISGTSPQTVAAGGNGTAVTAVPDSGYNFTSWSDSSTQNPRTDTSVSGNVSVTASFSAIPPAPNPIGDDLAAAQAGFASTTGFNISSLITWSGTNLITVFVGSGLGLLLHLRYWIVALLIVAGVIYFSFRAFRFYRN